jgi:hypothetical protein
MGASVFPVTFRGLFAIRPVPTGLAGRVTWLPICIPPRARANVLGIVNAMASAIVVYFMIVSNVSCVDHIGDNRTLTIKFFFSATAFLGAHPNA